MSGIDNLIEQLASATVEDEKEEKSVIFASRGLKLDTEADAKEIIDALNDCPGMTTFKLEGNTVGVDAAKAIAKALETQPKFRKALWKDMFTGRDKDEIPKALEYLSNGLMTSQARLVELDLSDNAFGPRGLVGLVKLLESPCCYTLQKLLLNNNGLGISGAKMLSKAMCNSIENSRRDGSPLALKTFVCGRNRLENEGATAISKFLKQLGSLESVALPQNGIYFPGVKELAEAFSSNPNLRVINLEDNSLTEKGARFIASCLSSLHKIQMLNFGDCIIRNGGAFSLAAALKDSCPDLRELYLGFNEIKTEGAKAIIDAVGNKENLGTLVLNGNQFGICGCEEISSKMAAIGKESALGTLSEDEEEDDDDDENDDDEGDEENCEDEEEDDEDDDVDTDSQDEIDIKSDEDINQKKSPHRSPMFKTSPKDYYSNPTPESLINLHKTNENILSALPENPSVSDCFDLFLKISMAVKPENEKAKSAACKYADDVLSKAFEICSDDISQFNNNFLVYLGLIKGEDRKKGKKIDITGALLILSHSVKMPYFHSSTKEFLQFFLSRPLTYCTASSQSTHVLMQSLFQA
ncbi:ran GTPase-activating protein 1-like [Uloborus diversus]|uniref:ran GTPase-activating protein 1-like n=1 Tax=Uloborus diversus TaxID=327109 RepID=UPI002409FE06|nr:ran GTPase-activating protein 1-like [Uloborus diversus]